MSEILMDPEEKNIETHGLALFFANHMKTRIFVFELFGSGFLLFCVLCTIYIPITDQKESNLNPFHNIYVTIILYVIICAIGPVSGSQVNPAITIAYFIHKSNLRKKDLTKSAIQKKKEKSEDRKLIWVYIFAQIIGAAIGVLLARQIYDIGGPIYPKTPIVFDLASDIFGQLIAVFMFTLMILILTNQTTTFIFDQAWIHLFIAVFFYISKTFSDHIGALNPAAVLAIQVQGMYFDKTLTSGTFYSVLCLILSEIMGGILAGIFFRNIYLKSMERWKKLII